MKAKSGLWGPVCAAGGFCAVVGGLALFGVFTPEVEASWWPGRSGRTSQAPKGQTCVEVQEQACGDLGGTWYWLRSPEQERRVVISLYDGYCKRCHGVDGRGVWDIPDVPDFSNARWQMSRSEAQLARAILEGRGAVMPAFRGTLTLEEAWAMSRYLRSFKPGSEASRPDLRTPEKPAEEMPTPKATGR